MSDPRALPPSWWRFQSQKHKHQIFLARGVDHAGNVYADPGRAYPELAEARGEGQSFVGAKR